MRLRLADVISNGLAQEQVRKAVREALRRGLTDREKLLGRAAAIGGKAEKVMQGTLAGEPDEVK